MLIPCLKRSRITNKDGTKPFETVLQTAAACFEVWRHETFAERADVVAKAAAIMHARVDEFARPETLEMGKLIAQAPGEVMLSMVVDVSTSMESIPKACQFSPLCQIRTIARMCSRE